MASLADKYPHILKGWSSKKQAPADLVIEAKEVTKAVVDDICKVLSSFDANGEYALKEYIESNSFTGEYLFHRELSLRRRTTA